ncbi:MAG TPA: 3-octaprenyl-4-hydroxybenzoate carboxy-lyase, partial [Planctomycetaceae bacterium]|nr:3-octaprenyl-4-hydroxybenzoate carboxy-lyase [Planctomycetaceae bacterium]
MGYRSLQQCVADLEKNGDLIRIHELIDPKLEAAAIQRRVFASKGPAILFTNVRGCAFPMVSNLFGTRDRVRYMFRDGLDAVRQLVELRSQPKNFIKKPWRFLGASRSAFTMLPAKVRRGPVLSQQTTTSHLPQLQSWPADGGPFITLPQVYTENVDKPGIRHSNLGMYRIQLAGDSYKVDDEVGLHYQIHRSIGVHHAAAMRAGKPFRVNIFIGGPPAMTVAAVMPLPEGMSELVFAGALGRRRIRMICPPDMLPIHADADFCITGIVEPNRLLDEGPFGDHLGYYSLTHPFPVMRVEKVY